MNLSSSLMTAAITGILGGAPACSGSTTPASYPGTPAATPSSDAAPKATASDSAMPMDTSAADGAKHDCKGKNECKGQGGCKM